LSIGTYAVQLACHFGAEVTAVTNPTSLDLMKSLGASTVFDYTQEDFRKSTESYDVIFDAVGKSSFSHCLKILNKNGFYLLANPSLFDMVRALWTSKTSSKRVRFAFADEKRDDLNYLKELIEAGKIKSVIDKCYPLEQMVEAHRYVDKGEKTGHVVITV